MPLWKTLKSVVVPGGVMLLAVVALAYSGWMTLPQPALNFLYYCTLAGGALLAWRFHSSRIFFSLCVLFLAQQAIAGFGGTSTVPVSSGWIAVRAASVLVPMNFVLIAFMSERGFTVASSAPVGLLLFLESVVVTVFCRSVAPVTHARHIAATVSLPGYAIVTLIGAGIVLLARFLFSRKPVDGALFWSLLAFFISLHFTGNARLSVLYSATAACILATSIIENSYLLAYHDELTTLPSRRAFNDALDRLQSPYSIAVVDIDHFKRFNDTYGHDTGDQVLRLVAASLSRVSGGGEAYRCGGEEFMILFPGKTTPEVVEHLERLRVAIESSEFRMRGGDRRQSPRGPDRRNERTAGRPRKKGQAIRQLAQANDPSRLLVTVSIGVATSSEEDSDPQVVLKSADKALYRAKDNGRNRLEIAPSKRRSRARAAGIA